MGPAGRQLAADLGRVVGDGKEGVVAQVRQQLDAAGGHGGAHVGVDACCELDREIGRAHV